MKEQRCLAMLGKCGGYSGNDNLQLAACLWERIFLLWRYSSGNREDIHVVNMMKQCLTFLEVLSTK
jgi:hypothetical protein